jgi:glyoxylase-like metal-dependent hydrolase (beta-lactamase superfamily II)
MSATLHWKDTNVEVHKVVVGPYDNNVFVIRCTATGEAVLIDAANEHEQLLELCRHLACDECLKHTVTGTTFKPYPQCVKQVTKLPLLR